MCLCGWSWAVLVASVRGLGVLLEPKLAVLGRSWASMGGPGPSWDLCWRSWAALGAYVAEKYEEHCYFENVLIS